MNILILVDKYNSAIDILSQSIKRHNSHFDIKVQSFHPKRPDIDQLEKAPKFWEEADLVQVGYWRSGEKFKELYPKRFKEKRKILCHYNPYDIEKQDWQKNYKKIVVGNETIQSKIPYAKLIPYGIDLGFWEFKRAYTKKKTVNMVVARIEGKKGIVPVAKACKELGYKFVLVGRISKMVYFKQIMEANPKTEFKENITNEELKKAYYNSAIHICNSVDNFESGTLPILEAMACGVPVLTRIVGHVPELFDGDNLIVREEQPDHYEELRAKLRELMENKPLREKMREKAWQTVKNRPAQKMARQFSKLYFEVMSEKKPLVSIITPTFDKPHILMKNLAKSVIQDYPNFEIVVADSGNQSVEPLITEFRKKTKVPIKYIRFENKGEYTLAKARNLAAVEAQGKYLVFDDERMGMQEDAVTKFVEAMEEKEKTWAFGVKDDYEKGFVENFSCIKRDDFILYGMLNERIDCYGGLTQETRTRFEKNGFIFELINDAKAYRLCGSKNKWLKKKEIIRSKFNIWKMYWG